MMHLIKKSFTLVELLTVIVIIMILAGILIGGIGYATKKADIAKTQSKLTELEVALDLFNVEYDFYPEAATESEVVFSYDDGLKIRIGSGKILPFVKQGTKQPLIEVGTMGIWKDAWETPFKYKKPGDKNTGSYDLWSYGPDGKSSNSDEKIDDICNWKRN